MSRNATILALLLATAAPAARAATCTTLTPADLRTVLVNDEHAVAFDDEGQTPSPLYLRLTSVSNNGAFTGTLATTLYPLPTFPPRPVFTVHGTLKPVAPAVLGMVFTYFEPQNRATTYSGAVERFPSCGLAFAGTYTNQVLLGHESVGPFPYSGKVVLVPQFHPGD